MNKPLHRYQDLINVFNVCFAEKYNTQLVKGGDEPLYLPAHKNQPYHTIYFAHGFFSSALHECAHWLIAGKERRKLIDYGYWYEPDGRTAEQQEVFYRVEAKPQAIEWLLSMAANHPFRLSIDNLNGPAVDIELFKQTVYQQVLNYCHQGLPARTTKFRNALCHFYKTPTTLQIEPFQQSFLTIV